MSVSNLSAEAELLWPRGPYAVGVYEGKDGTLRWLSRVELLNCGAYRVRWSRVAAAGFSPRRFQHGRWCSAESFWRAVTRRIADSPSHAMEVLAAERERRALRRRAEAFNL